MYTSSAISKIGLFDMSLTKSELRVGMQNRYIDRYQRSPEDPLVRQSFLLPWCFLPVTGPIIRRSERAFRE